MKYKINTIKCFDLSKVVIDIPWLLILNYKFEFNENYQMHQSDKFLKAMMSIN